MCQVDQPGIVGVMTKGSKPHLPIKSGLVRSYGWREGGKRSRGQHSGEGRMRGRDGGRE